MSKVKKALVTGGAGFVGTNLIKQLLKEGYDVTSIDNYHSGFKSNHVDGCGYINHDISDPMKLEIFGDFDIVFHLAAIARIQPSFKEPLEYFNTNALGTFNVAQYCCHKKIPMVFAGSSSHHSGKFKNPYTFSKDIGEEIIFLHQQIYGLKASVTRFYNVYGPHHLKEGGYCTVIGKWEKALETNNPITIYGDGTKRRDFTHIYDIVDALIRIDQRDAWGYTFELGRGKNYSIQEVAEMFEYDNIVYESDKPGEAIETLCTDSLAMEVLDWKAKFNLEDYIKEYITNFKTIA